jgi:hypothetical protein
MHGYLTIFSLLGSVGWIQMTLVRFCDMVMNLLVP